MKNIFYHEDDYCQIELLPIDCEAFIKNEIEKLNYFSEKNVAKEHIEWGDMYLKGEPPKLLKECNIEISDIEELFFLAEKYKKVYTGFASYREECHNMMAYGTRKIKIFISHENKTVETIWFNYNLSDKGAADELYNILSQITDKFDLIFVDWYNCFYSRIKKDKLLKQKLIDLATISPSDDKNK